MELVKNWRIVLLCGLIIASLLLVSTKGLSFGIDFIGGTELKMELGKGGEAYTDSVVEILKNRLNGLGLKSTQVFKESDGLHINIRVASVNQTDLNKVKEIINQQAVFEQLVEGQLCAKGEEIQLEVTRQGGAVTYGNQWEVYVKTNGDAPARCGKVMEGKSDHMTDIFLDRPANSFILIDSASCSELSSAQFANHPEDTGYTQLSFIEDRALIPVVCYDAAAAPVVINQSLLEELGVAVNDTNDSQRSLDLTSTVAAMDELVSGGKASVIIAINASELPLELRDEISKLNITLHQAIKGDKPFQGADESDSWIAEVIGLKSTLQISEGLTHGTPIYDSVFQGSGVDAVQAAETANKFKIWLTSGNLPIKTQIVLERPNLPELGQQFLSYVGVMALIALGLVASIVFIKYRKLKLSCFMLMTSFSEIVIILGFASLSSWELDMAAFAGIITAIGTGVDQQIVIADEALRGERRKVGKQEKRMWDIKDALNRASFIILTSVLTVVFAMIPLMSIIDLRGLAFTTIVGALIGLLITRPAFARIVEITM